MSPLDTRRFKKHGVRARKENSIFLSTNVEYLGHHQDAEGQYPLPDKLADITQVLSPRNVTELQFFLGCLNYYDQFITNLQSFTL